MCKAFRPMWHCGAELAASMASPLVDSLSEQDVLLVSIIRKQRRRDARARWLLSPLVGGPLPPPHGWHTLDKECKGVLSIGEPSWCRLNSKYHKTLAPFFIPI